MTSCRGVLVAGLTNRARTHMAEGFLRSFTGGRVFVASGGVYHDGTVHPMAARAMREYGVDISSQSPSSLEAARLQRNTYDVYVSVDAPYANRRADRFQRTAAVKAAEDGVRSGAGHLYGNPMLAPATPAHWGVGLDAADAHQRWNLWSPRDPAVSSERSTRKFQDGLYEGEPLFMQLGTNVMRVGMKATERWELEEVAEPYAMERPYEQQQRVAAACEDVCLRSLLLLLRLAEHYGEDMLTNEAALAVAAERSVRARALLAGEPQEAIARPHFA